MLLVACQQSDLSEITETAKVTQNQKPLLVEGPISMPLKFLERTKICSWFTDDTRNEGWLCWWEPAATDPTGHACRLNNLRWPRGILYPQKLALTSPTSGGRSVGIVRLRTKATE
jgi:hypothetical protein